MINGMITQLGHNVCTKCNRGVAEEFQTEPLPTLMTRGQKGCYVFCVDRETNEYFKRLQANAYPVGFGEREWPKVAEPHPPAYTPSTQSIRDSDS